MKIFKAKFTLHEDIWVIIYKLILDFSYVTVESKDYGYLGFDIKLLLHKIIAGFIVYFAAFNIIKSKKRNVTTLFVYTIFFLSIAPFITIYQFSTICKFWMVLVQIFCLVFMNFLFGVPFKFFVGTFKKYNYNARVQLIMTLLIIFYFLLMVWRFGIPSIHSMSLELIYITRANVSIPTGISILQTFFCRIICPIYILMAWVEKKWLYLSFGFLVQIYTYGITGFKTFLFIPFVLIIIEFLKNIDLKKMVIIGLSGSLLFVDLVYFTTNNIWPYALIGDRVIFFPGLIKYAYFDYFSNNDYVYFSQNTISSILGITSNYDIKIPNLIGDIYFDRPEMWTNTGFMADAYSNLGIIGVIIVALILTMILIFLKNNMTKIPSSMQQSVQMIFLLYFIMLNDGPLIATLFSGGFIAAVLIIALINF